MDICDYIKQTTAEKPSEIQQQIFDKISEVGHENIFVTKPKNIGYKKIMKTMQLVKGLIRNENM